jgi:hypothetical protein
MHRKQSRGWWFCVCKHCRTRQSLARDDVSTDTCALCLRLSVSASVSFSRTRTLSVFLSLTLSQCVSYSHFTHTHMLCVSCSCTPTSMPLMYPLSIFQSVCSRTQKRLDPRPNNVRIRGRQDDTGDNNNRVDHPSRVCRNHPFPLSWPFSATLLSEHPTPAAGGIGTSVGSWS